MLSWQQFNACTHVVAIAKCEVGGVLGHVGGVGAVPLKADGAGVADRPLAQLLCPGVVPVERVEPVKVGVLHEHRALVDTYSCQRVPPVNMTSCYVTVIVGVLHEHRALVHTHSCQRLPPVNMTSCYVTVIGVFDEHRALVHTHSCQRLPPINMTPCYVKVIGGVLHEHRALVDIPTLVTVCHLSS